MGPSINTGREPHTLGVSGSTRVEKKKKERNQITSRLRPKSQQGMSSHEHVEQQGKHEMRMARMIPLFCWTSLQPEENRSPQIAHNTPYSRIICSRDVLSGEIQMLSIFPRSHGRSELSSSNTERAGNKSDKQQTEPAQMKRQDPRLCRPLV